MAMNRGGGARLDHLPPALEVFHPVFGTGKGAMIEAREGEFRQRRVVDDRHWFFSARFFGLARSRSGRIAMLQKKIEYRAVEGVGLLNITQVPGGFNDCQPGARD